MEQVFARHNAAFRGARGVVRDALENLTTGKCTCFEGCTEAVHREDARAWRKTSRLQLPRLRGIFLRVLLRRHREFNAAISILRPSTTDLEGYSGTES